MLNFIGFLCFQARGQNNDNFQWYNYNLPIDERFESLVNSMTLDEKISQLIDESQEISRLGIPRYGWWNECLHGVSRTGRATIFPQAIGLAATFDDKLIKQIASAIGDEGRAKFNVAIKNNNRMRFSGLTYWSPNVNIFRDPRWGRGQETYGEDPYLTSRIGVAFVEGLQGNDPKYLKAAACAKHYVVHSGPEAVRHEFNAEVSKKDLWETYMPAFEALVTKARVEGVMGAYNRTNGESCCASPYLMTEILRKEWGFDGYFVSDCDAVLDIFEGHKLAPTIEEAAAMAIKAGTNLNCGTSFRNLKAAVEKGLVTEKEINQAVSQVFKTRFRLGFFDPDDKNPYTKIGPEVVGSDAHVKLALEAARKSIVLVKNKNNVLPLSKNLRTLFVTGPQAANEESLIGNYYGVSGNTVNFLDGIVKKVSVGTSVNYNIGQMPYHANANPIDWTTDKAANAEACIAVMGVNGMWEGEEGGAIASSTKGDQIDPRLPKVQVDFLKKIRTKGKNPLIVVITSGSPLIIPEVMEMADAVIYAFYPGEQGGNAVSDIIFGDVSPSGRMPFTVPVAIEDLPAYENYSLEGRTYRYMTKPSLIPFGFGLSYSTVTYKALSCEISGENVLVRTKLTNEGKNDVEEVAQLYVSSPLAWKDQPLFSLKEFSRTGLNAGESKTVEFKMPIGKFKLVNEKGERFLPAGMFKIYVSGAVPNNRSLELGAASPAVFEISDKQLK